MLIAVSGSQGSGKSSLINALIERNDYKVIERKTARSVLTDWGITMNNVFNNTNSICEFQDELLRRKFNDEREARNSDDIWFTERTYIDLLAYTVANVGRFNEHSNWLDDYYTKCIHNHAHYDKVIYIHDGLFDIQSDGVRPTNTHYSAMISSFIETYLKGHTLGKLVSITQRDLQHRVDVVESTINQLIKR